MLPSCLIGQGVRLEVRRFDAASRDVSPFTALPKIGIASVSARRASHYSNTPCHSCCHSSCCYLCWVSSANPRLWFVARAPRHDETETAFLPAAGPISDRPCTISREVAGRWYYCSPTDDIADLWLRLSGRMFVMSADTPALRKHDASVRIGYLRMTCSLAVHAGLYSPKGMS